MRALLLASSWHPEQKSTLGLKIECLLRDRAASPTVWDLIKHPDATSNPSPED